MIKDRRIPEACKDEIVVFINKKLDKNQIELQENNTYGLRIQIICGYFKKQNRKK